VADFKVDECNSCSARVIWAVTTRAATMPVDAEPAQGGNVQLEHRGEGTTPLARVLSPAQQFGKAGLRRSHFVTCPDAKSWRHKSVRRHG
jgi:hypothetical protein